MLSSADVAQDGLFLLARAAFASDIDENDKRFDFNDVFSVSLSFL
jgi:hypothetical protein